MPAPTAGPVAPVKQAKVHAYVRFTGKNLVLNSLYIIRGMTEQPRTTLHASHSGASARYCAQIPPTHDATMQPPQLQHPLRLPLNFLRTQKKNNTPLEYGVP